VAGLVQKYFEWVGLFDKLDPQSEVVDDARHERRNRLRLYQTAQLDGNHGSTWHWTERDGPEGGSSDRRGTIFSWV